LQRSLNRSITQALAGWLAAGETRMGEVVIRSGPYEVRHWLDAGAENLVRHSGASDSREIARYDAAGNYRPLKTAPNLRRGWVLELKTIEELHEALDGFYPAMLAARVAFAQQRLEVTPLRATLGRQSGMYAITKKISNERANALAGEFCRSDGYCLKTILWTIAPGEPVTSMPAEKFDPAADGDVVRGIPLLCAEACNLFVAKAREVVKSEGA
jgi:sirohydrochlorin cobaltochelatase